LEGRLGLHNNQKQLKKMEEGLEENKTKIDETKLKEIKSLAQTPCFLLVK
jgi:hypothetical protein